MKILHEWFYAPYGDESPVDVLCDVCYYSQTDCLGTPECEDMAIRDFTGREPEKEYVVDPKSSSDEEEA